MIDRERRKKNREIEVDRRRGPIHVEDNEAKVLEDDEEVSLIRCCSSIKMLIIDLSKINGPTTAEGTTQCSNLFRTR